MTFILNLISTIVTIGVIILLGYTKNVFINFIILLSAMYLYINSDNIENALSKITVLMITIILLGIWRNKKKEGFMVSPLKKISDHLTVRQCQDRCENDVECKYTQVPLGASKKKGVFKCEHSFGKNPFTYGSKDEGGDTWLNKKWKKPVMVTGNIKNVKRYENDSRNRIDLFSKETNMIPNEVKMSGKLNDLTDSWNLIIEGFEPYDNSVFKYSIKLPKSEKIISTPSCKKDIRNKKSYNCSTGGSYATYNINSMCPDEIQFVRDKGWYKHGPAYYACAQGCAGKCTARGRGALATLSANTLYDKKIEEGQRIFKSIDKKININKRITKIKCYLEKNTQKKTSLSQPPGFSVDNFITSYDGNPDLSVDKVTCKKYAKAKNKPFKGGDNYRHNRETPGCFTWNKDVYYNNNLNSNGKCNYRYGVLNCVKNKDKTGSIDDFITTHDGSPDPSIDRVACRKYAQSMGLPYTSKYSSRNLVYGCQLWNGNHVYFNSRGGVRNCKYRDGTRFNSSWGKCVKSNNKIKNIISIEDIKVTVNGWPAKCKKDIRNKKSYNCSTGGSYATYDIGSMCPDEIQFIKDKKPRWHKRGPAYYACVQGCAGKCTPRGTGFLSSLK